VYSRAFNFKTKSAESKQMFHQDMSKWLKRSKIRVRVITTQL